MEFILWILLGLISLLCAFAINDIYEWEKIKRKTDDDDNIIGEVEVDDDNYLYKGFFLSVKCKNRKEKEEREKKLADYYQIYHDYYHKEPYMTNWKPRYGGRYCIPVIKDDKVKCEYYSWMDDVVDHSRYQDGIVCKTKEEALEIGKQILSGAKKLKYDKEFFYLRYFSRPWSVPYTIDVGYNSCKYPNRWSCY